MERLTRLQQASDRTALLLSFGIAGGMHTPGHGLLMVYSIAVVDAIKLMILRSVKLFSVLCKQHNLYTGARIPTEAFSFIAKLSPSRTHIEDGEVAALSSVTWIL